MRAKVYEGEVGANEKIKVKLVREPGSSSAVLIRKNALRSYFIVRCLFTLPGVSGLFGSALPL